MNEPLRKITGTFFGKIQNVPKDYLIRTSQSHDQGHCKCPEHSWVGNTARKLFGNILNVLMMDQVGFSQVHCPCPYNVFTMSCVRKLVFVPSGGLCRCGQRATSELSYAEEMDQRQDTSSPTPPSSPSSPPTDGSYQTPVTESVTRLVPIPEEVHLPSPTSSEEEPIPVPPPRAVTPGREVSGQRCWTRRKFDKTPGSGASGRLFWRSSGLRGKDHVRPYSFGRGKTHGSSGDWRVRVEEHAGPSEPASSSHRQEHGSVSGVPQGTLCYGWKSLSPDRSP